MLHSSGVRTKEQKASFRKIIFKFYCIHIECLVSIKKTFSPEKIKLAELNLSQRDGKKAPSACLENGKKSHSLFITDVHQCKAVACGSKESIVSQEFPGINAANVNANVFASSTMRPAVYSVATECSACHVVERKIV